MLAADKVDSTTGLQMAYLKEWAPPRLAPSRSAIPRCCPAREVKPFRQMRWNWRGS